MLQFLCQRYEEFPYVRCHGLMFQVCHGGISVGTALRAFGLSGNQTFAFGLQFRIGNPLSPYYEFSRMDFLTALIVMKTICPLRKRRIIIQHSYTLL